MIVSILKVKMNTLQQQGISQKCLGEKRGIKVGE
jgi:hypothetical protein